MRNISICLLFLFLLAYPALVDAKPPQKPKHKPEVPTDAKCTGVTGKNEFPSGFA